MMLKTKTQIKLKLSLYRILYFLTKSNYFYRKKKKYKLLLNDYKKLNHIASIQVPTDFIKINSENLLLSQSSKRKILIIGTLDSNISNKLSFYCNSFCKSIPYSNSIVHFFDTHTNKMHCIKNEEYWQNESYKHELYSVQSDCLDASQYDTLIYFIDSAFSSENIYKYAKINIAYFVRGEKFSNIISSSLNRLFDLIIVSNDSDKKILEENEVYRPIFIFPVSLNLNYYENISNKLTSKPFKIGCIGQVNKLCELVAVLNKTILSEEVNLELLYTPNDTNAQLGYLKNYKQKLKELKKYSSEKIRIEKCDVIEFFGQVAECTNDNDCIIYLNECENYLYNPYQGITAGKIVLYPNSYSLEESPGEGLVTYTKKDKIDIKNKLEYIIKNYDKLLTEEKRSSRRKLGQSYSKKTNSEIYNNLLNPKQITLSQQNRIDSKSILTKDKNLYHKFNKNVDILEGKKITIVPACDVGFFACLNKLINYVSYAEKDEVVIPDWRVSTLHRNVYNYWHQNTFGSFCYGKGGDGNIFFKLFKPKFAISEALLESDLMYEYSSKNIDMYGINTETNPNISYIYSYNLYNDDEYFKKLRLNFHKALNNNYMLNDKIQSKIDKFYNENLKGFFVISMHIRCKSHALELKEENSFEIFDKTLKKILLKNNISEESNNWKLFIACDNDLALLYFCNKYPSNVVYQKDVKRLSVEDENEYEKIKGEKNGHIYGYELQARNSSSECNRDIKLAIDMLTDAYLLSKGKYFLFKNSNVSTGVSYLNPDIEMVYCK